MKLIPENTNRKVDSLGRITLPKGLRARLNVNENDEVAFYTTEEEGTQYICLEIIKEDSNKIKYLQAAEVLNALNIEVPPELEEMLNA